MSCSTPSVASRTARASSSSCRARLACESSTRPPRRGRKYAAGELNVRLCGSNEKEEEGRTRGVAQANVARRPVPKVDRTHAIVVDAPEGNVEDRQRRRRKESLGRPVRAAGEHAKDGWRLDHDVPEGGVQRLADERQVLYALRLRSRVFVPLGRAMKRELLVGALRLARWRALKVHGRRFVRDSRRLVAVCTCARPDRRIEGSLEVVAEAGLKGASLTVARANDGESARGAAWAR